MDKRFFRSREFAVAVVISLFLSTGVAIAIGSNAIGIGSFYSMSHGCRDREVDGAPFEVMPVDHAFAHGSDATRMVEYVFNTTTTGGRLDLCSMVGRVRIVPSEDDQVRLTFTIDARGGNALDAVKETRIEAAFATQDGQLNLAGWQATRAETTGFFGRRSVDTQIELQVPQTGAYEVAGVSDIGSITVERLIVGDLKLLTDVGDIRATAVHVQGNVTMATDVGEITARFASMQSGEYKFGTDVGEIDVRFPSRNDTGYDIVASTDVGSIRLDEFRDGYYRDTNSGPGGTTEARSADYDQRLVRIIIRATTDVGGITILSASQS